MHGAHTEWSHLRVTPFFASSQMGHFMEESIPLIFAQLVKSGMNSFVWKFGEPCEKKSETQVGTD